MGSYTCSPLRRSALDILRQRAAAQGTKRRVTWSEDVGEEEIRRLREIEMRLGEMEASDRLEIGRLKIPMRPLISPAHRSGRPFARITAACFARPLASLWPSGAWSSRYSRTRIATSTITGYLPRMRRSFGVLYLGLDPDQDDGAYERESGQCNRAIMGLDRPAAFMLARASTHRALQALVDETIGYAREDGETRWDLTVDARELLEPLLADFCEEWFGLSEDGDIFPPRAAIAGIGRRTTRQTTRATFSRPPAISSSRIPGPKWKLSAAPMASRYGAR